MGSRFCRERNEPRTNRRKGGIRELLAPVRALPLLIRLGDDEYEPRGQISFSNSILGNYIINVDPPVNGMITYSWDQLDEVMNEALQGIGAGGEVGVEVSDVAAVGGGFL